MNQDRKALLTPLSVFGKPTELIYQAGKEAERERIIALLDSIGFHSIYLDDGSHKEDCDGCELVALINGDN